MLVLSRIIGESITIGDEIFLRIVAVNGNSVRVGIEAPRNIEVHRAEIYERIRNGLAPPVKVPGCSVE